jgi:hypothetical protein
MTHGLSISVLLILLAVLGLLARKGTVTNSAEVDSAVPSYPTSLQSTRSP